MLEFATLFLGLFWGAQPVELLVGDAAIARVEIHLDGEQKAALDKPPWRTTIDFGALAPHHLEAFAFSATGLAMAHAEQWINLPRAQAEARIVVETDATGAKTRVRLSWENIDGRQPSAVEVRLDGELLKSEDSYLFELPPLSLQKLHFLTAELTFSEEQKAQATATFGGFFGDEVVTELTAFPVRAKKAGVSTEPPFSCFSGRDGKVLRVADVERGGADVVLVRDGGANLLVQRLATEAGRGVGPGRTTMPKPDQLRQILKLEPGDRVRFLWPKPLLVQHPSFLAAGSFEGTPYFGASDGGLLYFLTRLFPSQREGGPQHLADAVALAGLRASAAGRRRSVVLVLGDTMAKDASTKKGAEVRDFLSALAVPLHVWSGAVAPGKHEAADWPARSIRNLGHLNSAFRELEEDLESQRIVWLEGRHLVEQVRFDAAHCGDFTPLVPPAGNRSVAQLSEP